MAKEGKNGPRFITPEIAAKVEALVGTPAYVYSYETLIQHTRAALSFPNAFGLTVRYAMKANSNATILRTFQQNGVKIDASSGYEIIRALAAGFSPKDISLSSQEFSPVWVESLKKGVEFNACSLAQIRAFGENFPGGKLGLRINPGLGSGHHTFANVGGKGSSFGIWHTHVPQIKNILNEFNLHVNRIHTHIGSGVDPQVWERVASLSLNIAREFPEVTSLNLGGGFKVARMPHEKATSLQECGERVRKCFEDFAKETGRKLHLEIEPGTFLTAHSGSIVARVEDVVDTGADGHNFIKLNCGMGEILRPVLYHAQHPIFVFSEDKQEVKSVVVGHCCESGDALSMNSDGIAAWSLPRARRGDFAVLDSVGSYCASMSAVNYNSYPAAPEVLLVQNRLEVIRVRQSMEHMLANERNVILPKL